MQANYLRYPSVRVALNDKKIVVGIAVAGRPHPHPFKGGFEGSHLTPWSVFCDTVRRATAGYSVSGAAREVRHLLEQLDDEKGTESAKLTGQRKIWFNQMIDQGWDVLKEAQLNGDVTQLQQGIAMYLTGRNLAPLSAIFLGPDRAKGRGEAPILHKLRAFEESSTWFESEQLSEMLTGLLDMQAVKYLTVVRNDSIDTVPGMFTSNDESTRFAVSEHLREVARAYPVAYEASELGTPEVYNRYFGSLAPVPHNYTRLPQARDDWDDAPLGWSTTSANLCLANLRFRQQGGDVVIRDVDIEGRGNTLLNTQGHHVTAHTLIEAGVRGAVVGQTPPAAIQRMLELAGSVRDLATYPNVDRLPADQDPKGVYAKAFAAFTAAGDAADYIVHNTDRPEDLIPVLEDLIGSYIMMRNALPMAAVMRGALANPKAEGRAMTLLKQWDRNRKNLPVGKVLWTMWCLIDLDAVLSLWTDDDRLHEWAPGAPVSAAQRVAAVLSVHLDTMERAFPLLAAQAGLRTTGSVTWVLEQKGIVPPNTFRDLLGLRVENVYPEVSFKSGRKSDEDGEWRPGKRNK